MATGRVRSALVLVATLTAAAPGAWADAPRPAWLCAPPRTQPFNECWKGESFGEREVDECRARQVRRRPRSPPRIRVDHGAWVALAPARWRCVPIPPRGRPRVFVENYGRVYQAWYLDELARPCASGVLDVVGPTFYGSMYARCSRRDHRRDERVGAAPAPAP